MIRLLTSLLYWGSIAGIIALDIFFWFNGWALGLLGILGLIVFVVAYAYSVEMSIAPRDFWVNPEFEIVKKKLLLLVIWSYLVVILIQSGKIN